MLTYHGGYVTTSLLQHIHLICEAAAVTQFADDVPTRSLLPVRPDDLQMTS